MCEHTNALIVEIILNTSYAQQIDGSNYYLCKGNWVVPRLALGGEIWQWLWQLDLLLLTRQQDIFYCLAPNSVVGRFKGTHNKVLYYSQVRTWVKLLSPWILYMMLIMNGHHLFQKTRLNEERGICQFQHPVFEIAKKSLIMFSVKWWMSPFWMNLLVWWSPSRLSFGLEWQWQVGVAGTLFDWLGVWL